MLGRVSDEYSYQIFFGAKEKNIFWSGLESPECRANDEKSGKGNGVPLLQDRRFLAGTALPGRLYLVSVE
jgi:hypothetical protein